MALFDIIEDVSKKQIEKTDTGDGRIMGVMLGKVVKNYDKDMPGRVQLMLLSREQSSDQSSGGSQEDADASRILWAKVVMPSSGQSWGHYFIPEVGDLVLVTFEQGNIERAYVIGCIPKTKDKILTGSTNEKNKFKKITTRYGSTITFEDVAKEEGEEGDDGAKDKIRIETANQSHKIILNNEKKQIQIQDKEGNNKIVLDTDADKGHIQITAAKKLTIKVGDGIELVMNSSSNTVTLKTGKFKVEATEGINMESNARAELKGANASIEGSSMLKLESSGPVVIGGKPVKLG